MARLGHLLVRADAGADIGGGHVMRCLALADAWVAGGGEASFASSGSLGPFQTWLLDAGIPITEIAAHKGTMADASELLALARESGADWVVVDGYHFGRRYQHCLVSAGLSVFLISDGGDPPAPGVEAFLCQGANPVFRGHPQQLTSTRHLFGPDYTLLRRPFWAAWRMRRAAPRRARKVLVTMGAGNSHSVTPTIIRALQHDALHELEATVVVGPLARGLPDLIALAAPAGGQIELRENVREMALLMSRCDLAVTSAGVTCRELDALGVPMIAIPLSNNQQPVAEEMARAGAGLSLGHGKFDEADVVAALRLLAADKPTRWKMGEAGRALVDGLGALRAVALLAGYPLLLRPARWPDVLLAWRWANDPTVRRVSFSEAAIGWEEHIAWFQQQLNDPNTFYLIAESEARTPIGQIRFHLDGPVAELSVLLAAEHRGRGLGERLIKLGSWIVMQCTETARIRAEVKPGNDASVRAFSAAGFRGVPGGRVRGKGTLRFILEREDARL